jgi:hypothetical protein
LCIAFDNPEPGLISERAYEKTVDLAASLAWHFSNQEAELSFVVPGRPRTRDLHEFLAWLAVIEPGTSEADSTVHGTKKGESFRDVLREMNLTSSDAYNIVVTARQRGSLPAALWNCSYFVFALS